MMPSVIYMNNSAPFWDSIAGPEQQGSRNPCFSQNCSDKTDNDREVPQGPQDLFAPFRWSGPFFGGGRAMPHRGGPPHERHKHHHKGATSEQNQDRTDQLEGEQDAEINIEDDNGEGPSKTARSDHEAHHGGRPRGRCGGGHRGRCSPGGPYSSGPHHAYHPCGSSTPYGPHYSGHRGGWGSWTRGGPFGGMQYMSRGPFGAGDSSWNPCDPSAIPAQLFNQFVDTHPSNTTTNATKPTESEDYTPDTDIFHTESAYVVHVSLPGAKKEDVDVNWDVEKSELSIAGVIYRPSDEEFLKALALNERKVGAFGRRIRLGTMANPANVDADGITAKLEDGVLRVEVPKLDSGYVEVRKVDIE